MAYIQIGEDVFKQLGILPVPGFTFFYQDNHPEYGVMFRTGDALPQVQALYAAADVGTVLQYHMFGKQAEKQPLKSL